MDDDLASRIVAAKRNRRPTKTLVYQHALDLFAARGFARTGLRDIAEAVGVEVPSLYTHIASKKALLFDLMEFGTRDLIQRLHAAVDGVSGSPLAELFALTRSNVLSHCEHQNQTIVAYNEIRELEGDQRDRIIALRREVEAMFDVCLSRGIAAGVMRPVDIHTTTFGILSMSRGAAVWYREDGELGAEEIAARYADQVVRSVASTRIVSGFGDAPVSIDQLVAVGA